MRADIAPGMTAPTLELDVDPIWGDAIDWEALAARAAQAAASVAPELAHDNLLVSLVLGDDAEVQTLNKQWRAKDRPTNVLSFPMLERGELLALEPEGPPELLGDIAIAHATCVREAAEKGIPLEHHAAHLIVHGLLHLAGHDHETCAADADAMEALEIKALAHMGIGNPYCVAPLN